MESPCQTIFIFRYWHFRQRRRKTRRFSITHEKHISPRIRLDSICEQNKFTLSSSILACFLWQTNWLMLDEENMWWIRPGWVIQVEYDFVRPEVWSNRQQQTDHYWHNQDAHWWFCFCWVWSLLFTNLQNRSVAFLPQKLVVYWISLLWGLYHCLWCRGSL